MSEESDLLINIICVCIVLVLFAWAATEWWL